MPRVLIIGYGNSVRTDDGVGVVAAESLRKFYGEDPAVRVMSAHQLTPDMACDMADSEYVLFLDAAVGDAPGTIRKTAITPEDGAGLLTHHCTPAALLIAAGRLYGRTPAATSLTICLLYTSPSPRDYAASRMPSSA